VDGLSICYDHPNITFSLRSPSGLETVQGENFHVSPGSPVHSLMYALCPPQISGAGTIVSTATTPELKIFGPSFVINVGPGLQEVRRFSPELSSSGVGCSVTESANTQVRLHQISRSRRGRWGGESKVDGLSETTAFAFEPGDLQQSHGRTEAEEGTRWKHQNSAHRRHGSL
jgi:hypothetical protein